MYHHVDWLITWVWDMYLGPLTLWLPQVLNQSLLDLKSQCTCAGGSTDLGLYLWGNRPLPTVQDHPVLVSGGWLPNGGWVRLSASHCGRSTHRAGALQTAPCHSGERPIGLTHRAGATHRSRAVGAPARWAGVDFPTGINLAHCSDRT